MTDAARTDTDRDNLRAAIRSHIIGELRLARSDTDDILKSCAEIHIDEGSPPEERDGFVAYADKCLSSAQAMLDAERATWPAVTDCDRLDRAEHALRDRGIAFWQVSPCCDTCTMGEFGERINEIEAEHPGFSQRLRGYAFFIDQTMPEMLAEGSQIDLYLGYGWISPDGSTLPPDQYNPKAIAVGHEVVDCLATVGLAVDWDATIERKIGVSLDWKRRRPR